MSTPSQTSEVHEFAAFKFKEDFSRQEQLETMRRIDPYIARFDGFRSREFFFSEADGRWVDHIVWDTLASAKASEKLLEQPEAAALFERMDPSTVVFSRYQKVSK